MRKNKENFATEIIGRMKQERNFWRLLAVVAIVLNIVQLFF